MNGQRSCGIYIRIKIDVHISEYYSAIKENECESVLVRGMNLEPVTEYSKSENKYSIHTHIHGI